jgi:hypothetical protein
MGLSNIFFRGFTIHQQFHTEPDIHIVRRCIPEELEITGYRERVDESLVAAAFTEIFFQMSSGIFKIPQIADNASPIYHSKKTIILLTTSKRSSRISISDNEIMTISDSS